MTSLETILAAIQPIDVRLLKEAQVYCDTLAKPLGALGKLEQLYQKLYAIQKRHINIDKKVVIVYVADNGIVAENISANPQSTTYQVGKNILSHQTGVCLIAAHANSDVVVVDIGCCQDVTDDTPYKVMYGTRNSLQEPAMRVEQAEQAILMGYKQTLALIEQGYTLFGTGEMGVGNTTTAACVISCLLAEDPEKVVGYGAGLTDAGLQHKVAVVKAVLDKYQDVSSVLEQVASLGGLDMLGMVGTYLACAEKGLPCVIDGVISIAGLLIASRLNPHVLDYCFASHCSSEPGYQLVSQALKMDPLLMLDMRLGEGSGCPLAFFLLDNAVYTLQNMPTFDKAKLSKNDYVDIRKDGK